MGDGQGLKIPSTKARQPQERPEPASFRLPLTRGLRLEQFNGPGQSHLAHAVNQDHQKQGGKELEALWSGPTWGTSKLDGHGEIQNPEEHQQDQFGKEHAGAQPHRQAEQGDKQRFPAQDLGDVAFFQA